MEYVHLMLGDCQLRDVGLPDMFISKGYSLKNWFATVPVAHDLKQVLRYFVIDILLLVCVCFVWISLLLSGNAPWVCTQQSRQQFWVQLAVRLL